jgi:acetyl esterase
MRAFPGSRLKWMPLAVALLVGAVALAGCAPTGSESTHVTARHPVLYSKFQTYPNIPVDTNLQYGDADGQALRLDVCLPDTPKGTKIAPRPAIVSIHGGSWAHGDKANIDWRSVCQWLASEGYVTASVGYQLAPEHPYPAAIDNIRAAVRWLRAPAQVTRYKIDPTLIGAFGGSAGGNLAALLGTSGTTSLDSGGRVAAVAELSGPANLTASGPELPDFEHYVLSYLGCTTFAQCPAATKASPLYQVNKTDPPFFIAHSTNERIPLSQSAALVRKLRSVGVDTTFVTVKGQLHSIAMLDRGMRDRIAEFFHTKLVHNAIGAVR